MTTTFLRLVLPTLGLAMGIQGVGMAKETTSEPLQGKEWQSLAMVTGFHALANRELGLEMRVLEADGSASVAENPITLFIVAINGGNSDPEEHLWRLPVQVAEVRKAVVNKCGLQISALVEGEGEPGAPGKKSPVVIKACFLRDQNKLDSKLRTEILPAK